MECVYKLIIKSYFFFEVESLVILGFMSLNMAIFVFISQMFLSDSNLHWLLTRDYINLSGYIELIYKGNMFSFQNLIILIRQQYHVTIFILK